MMRTMATTAMVPFAPEEARTRGARAQWVGVVPVDLLSQWQVQAVKMVLQTANLLENWDTYGSAAPTPAAVDTAMALIMQIDLEDIPVPYVVPVPGGGIQLEWIMNQRELELEVLPDGSVEFLKTESGQPTQEGPLARASPPEIASLVAWLV